MTIEYLHSDIPGADTLDFEGFVHPVQTIEEPDGSTVYFVRRPNGQLWPHTRLNGVDEDGFLEVIQDFKEDAAWTPPAGELAIPQQASGNTEEHVVADIHPETATQAPFITTFLKDGPSEETTSRLDNIATDQKRAAKAPPVEEHTGLAGMFQGYRRRREMRRNREHIDYGRLRAEAQAAAGIRLRRAPIIRG